MGNAALVTLAIGEPCLSAWRDLFADGWKHYAARHNLDIVVIDKPVDAADQRGLSWQKCLVPMTSQAQRYERIALVDADIAINPRSPNIFEQVPAECIGGVLASSHIHPDLRGVLIGQVLGQELRPEQERAAIEQNDRTAYESQGLPPHAEGIVQCGVLVLSPRRHADLFHRAFEHAGPEARSYEQTPLSHQILSSGHFKQIDSRFNSVLLETLHVHHPYAVGTCGEDLMRAIVRSEFNNNFFLHFAYGQSHLARLL